MDSLSERARKPDPLADIDIAAHRLAEHPAARAEMMWYGRMFGKVARVPCDW
jgi:hypothetical protein